MAKSQQLIRPLMAGLAVLLAGCAPVDTRPFVSPTQAFDEATIKGALEEGGGEIDGQAFSRTVGGEVRYAAGIPISLIPVTPYVRECMGIAGSYAQSNCGARIAPYRRQMTGDGEGRFKFRGLRPGDYYLECEITWGVPTQLGVATTGGFVKKVVTVPDPPGVVDVILN